MDREIAFAKKDPTTLLFSVKDTGHGITAADRPKMFLEGGQGADSIKIHVHSSRYGLFTAKNIVEAHGGNMWFDSEGIPGKGTTLFVELPV